MIGFFSYAPTCTETGNGSGKEALLSLIADEIFDFIDKVTDETDVIERYVPSLRYLFFCRGSVLFVRGNNNFATTSSLGNSFTREQLKQWHLVLRFFAAKVMQQGGSDHPHSTASNEPRLARMKQKLMDQYKRPALALPRFQEQVSHSFPLFERLKVSKFYRCAASIIPHGTPVSLEDLALVCGCMEAQSLDIPIELQSRTTAVFRRAVPDSSFVPDQHQYLGKTAPTGVATENTTS